MLKVITCCRGKRSGTDVFSCFFIVALVLILHLHRNALRASNLGSDNRYANMLYEMYLVLGVTLPTRYSSSPATAPIIPNVVIFDSGIQL
jgi:hypothetical protein